MKGKITLENGEVIVFDLFEEEAPITVANFVKLVESGYYDGKIFHRVIKDFVSQGGCPYGNGTGDLGYTIPCEASSNIHRHEAGTLSMAHRGKDTGCCQFFICHTPQPHLNGVHTVFGQVTDGLDNVRKMSNGTVMKKVEIIEK